MKRIIFDETTNKNFDFNANDTKTISIDQPQKQNFDVNTKVIQVNRKWIPLCISCSEPGKWRQCTKEVLCEACKLKPQFRLMCRSTVLNLYGPSETNANGLTKDDLFQAYQAKKIRMYTIQNKYYNDKSHPARLYHQYEIEQLFKQKQHKFGVGEYGLGNSKPGAGDIRKINV